MKTPSAEEDPRESRALTRFAAVQAVLQARQAGQTLVQSVQYAAQQCWDGRYYTASAIEEWYYRYQKGKFGALVSPRRSDRGQNRALDPAAVEALLALRREQPLLTVPALTAELVRRGVLEQDGYSTSTVHRRLADAGLDRRSLKAGAGATGGGPLKAFELPLPNLLWMADCMHGPTIKAAGRLQRTYLFALIDDCSRLLVHGQFYAQERLGAFLDTLRRAVETRAVPDKLYTDNGAAFKSQHLQIVCANLGIRLIHAKPYHAWSKGKIERLFHTVQSQFLAALSFSPPDSLEEMNRRFWQWAEMDYNHREHSALAGESPAQRFARLGTTLRLLEPGDDLDRLFLMRLRRRVRKDATFSLGGIYWEVPPHLRGQMISVYFDPIDYRRVEVWLGDRLVGQARRCDKQLNSQLRSSNDYTSQRAS